MLWIVLFLACLTAVRFALSAAEHAEGSSAPPLRLAGELLEAAIIAFTAVFLVLRPFVAQAFYIPSDSMHPTLQRNDRILVNKLAYRFAPVQRDDVVVFRAPPAASRTESELPAREEEFVKRVVGLPGDTVEIHDGLLYVNGEPHELPNLRERAEYEFPPYVVPPGRLFVLGDNRNHSNDSHRWGSLETSRVIGRVAFIYWPPGRLGRVR
jgi:signal peptidase I